MGFIRISLLFEELKVEFKKLMRSIESFMPMGSKERVKRAGVQLEQESLKKQKIAVKHVPVTEEKVEVVKKEEPIKRTEKKKQKARNGVKKGFSVAASMVSVSGSYNEVEKDCLSVGLANTQQMVISSPCLTYIKNWLVQSKRLCNEALAIPEQTATSKEISNPFMAGSLLKTT
ncbi:hypothetical protein Tco_0290098 [Tanacetum coccineum]